MASQINHVAIILVTLLLTLFSNAAPTSPGCGRISGLDGTTKKIMIQSGNPPNHIREFYIDLPAFYDPYEPTSMVLGFHGANKTWEDMKNITRLSEPSINPDRIVVYPQGLKGPDGRFAWEGAPYANKNVSDLDFTKDILRYMRNNYCIDNTRIYATGKSNGGGFVNLLACTPSLAENFAAFAPVAAALYTESPGSATARACNASMSVQGRMPVPMIGIHSNDDRVIPFDNATYVRNGVLLPTITSFWQTWAIRNGCPDPPVPEILRDSYSPNNDDWAVAAAGFDCGDYEESVEDFPVVVGLLLKGQKHWWPSRWVNEENKGAVGRLEASETILSWFDGWVRSDEQQNATRFVSIRRQ